MNNKKRYKFIGVAAVLMAVFSTITARTDTLRTFGDTAQIINPLVALALSSQSKGMPHYTSVQIHSLGLMGASKIAGNELKLSPGKRPGNLGYTGMPSGHTTSAWSAASYVRHHGGKHQWVAVPLYTSALITAYSRVASKQHTKTQVIAAIILSETVNEISSNPKWCQEHHRIDVSLNSKGVGLNFTAQF